VEGGTEKSGSHKVTKSGQYWAFAHFTRHIKRGAKVFTTNGVAPGGKSAQVSYSGFVNPDGKHVLVLANKGPEQRTQLVLGTNALDLTLPAESVHTLEWS
jgi:glucosylceramidase